MRPATIRVDTRYDTEVHGHRLDGVDLLGHPHGPELGGGAGTDGRHQRDPSHHRRDDADVEERRQEPVSASIPMLPSDEYPWTAMTPPEAGHERRDPTVPPMIAKRADAHGHLGDQPDRLLAVAGQRIGDAGSTRRRTAPPARRSRRPPGDAAEQPPEPVGGVVRSSGHIHPALAPRAAPLAHPATRTRRRWPS